jgi:hypothetical protein
VALGTKGQTYFQRLGRWPKGQLYPNGMEENSDPKDYWRRTFLEAVSQLVL